MTFSKLLRLNLYHFNLRPRGCILLNFDKQVAELKVVRFLLGVSRSVSQRRLRRISLETKLERRG